MTVGAHDWHGVQLPRTRMEAWDGDRLVRTFEQRPLSLAHMLADAVAKSPERPALIEGSRCWNYADLGSRAQAMASQFSQQGLQAGDRVLMFVRNRAEFLFVFFALQSLGAIAVPVGIREQRPGLQFILNQCQARGVVFDGDLWDRIPDASECPQVQWRWSLDPIDAPNALQLSVQPTKGPLGPVTPGPVDPAGVSVILYTSGTTGRPKGAMLTHRNISHSALHYQLCMGLNENDRSALAVPASHVTGLIAMIATFVHTRASVVIVPEFKASRFLDLMERDQITHTLLVPAMYNLCLLDPGFQTRQLSAWRLGGYGGAPMPVSVIDGLARHLPGLTLLNAYGATETTSPTTLMPAGQTRSHADTVGVALPCADVRIMNDEGQEVPTGETGEIWIGGPMVVPGYWDNPQATAESFTAGYWHSGDLGSKDAQGYIRLFDRKKDMLNRGGFKIYSVEVENCLMGIPGVLEAAIVGRPCPVLGERVHAFLYAPGTVADNAAVLAHARAHLADYKLPETLTWLEQPLPRNANGKVMKRVLREQLPT